MSAELPVPAPALRDPESVEMLRAWIAEQGLHCSIKVGMYEERGIDEARAWAILLSDVMHHVSQALGQRYSRNASETLLAMRAYLIEELDRPTSGHSGDFV